jgi:two-component system, chemotaxis family, protein-glutamate methylesterase/glutaminase
VTGLANPKAEGGPFTKPVIGIATSAGGLSAVSRLLNALPPTLDAAILVVQHLDPARPSHLADILARRTTLAVKQAASNDHLQVGVVLIAPPGAHILVDHEGTISLSHRPPVHFVRPAADRLFESIAGSFGPRAVAVVLTGTGHDGATGAQAVKQAGGRVIVQDESTSEFFGMPKSAIDAGQVDQILPLDQIAPALVAICGEVE